MIFAHFRQSLQETFPTRATEWAFSLMLFMWSVVLMLNTDLFTSTKSFGPMLAFAPQPVWTWSCLVVGGGRLVMLAINGAWRRSPHLRSFSAFVSCFFWFQISVGMLQSGVFSTGLAVYPVIFLFEVYNVFRAARDAGTSDRIHIAGHAHGPHG